MDHDAIVETFVHVMKESNRRVRPAGAPNPGTPAYWAAEVEDLLMRLKTAGLAIGAIGAAPAAKVPTKKHG